MFGPKELVVVLVVLLIVLVVFGPKRIKSLGSELGNAITGFRKAVRDNDVTDAKNLEHDATAGTPGNETADKRPDKRQSV